MVIIQLTISQVTITLDTTNMGITTMETIMEIIMETIMETTKDTIKDTILDTTTTITKHMIDEDTIRQEALRH